MRQNKLMVLILFGILFTAEGAVAQTQAEMRFLQPTASLSGNTGLWKVHSPINLAPGQAAFSVWADRINRNPGLLTITTYGFGGSAGLTSWLELGVNFEVNRRILVRRASELSLGQQQLGFFGTKLPGAAPNLAELMPGSTLMPQLRNPALPTGALSGAAGYYNAFPFANRIQGNGIGTVGVGLKISIFSEADGHPFDLGVRTYANIPTHRSASFLRERPSQPGAWIIGSDFLVGKNVGDMADLYFNAGYRGYDSPDSGRGVTLSDVVPLSFAFAIPRNTRFQIIQEYTAELLVGSRTANTSQAAEDVVDLTVGLRAFLNRYLNFSAGYRTPMNQGGGDKHGFVFQLGYTYGSPMVVTPPSPPSLSCSANPSEATVGQMVQLTASGSSSSGAPLTYEWSTNGGTIQGSGQTVQVSTAGLAPGSYIATVRATERPGLFADCSTRFTVVQPAPPPMPPTVTCSADRTRVQVGEVVNMTAQANSPDGHPLTYQWSTTGGSIVGSGPTVRLDTTGARPGTVTATARVTDDRNLSASCTNTITVEAPPPPPPPPQVMLLDTCQFGLNSARVDNVCKAKLDSIALRLQSESDASLTVVGYAASNERNAQQLSQTRADNVRAYLSRDKGIPEGRLTSRTGAAGTGAAARKAEMHLVPRGATFMGYNLGLDLERSRSAQAAALRSPAVARQPQRQAPSSHPEQAAVAATGRRVLASLR